MGHNLKCLEAKRMGVASVTGAIVNQIRMGWKAPPSSICPVCSMSAFPAESYMAADRTPYHRACLKCNKCCKRLTPSSMAEHDKMLYCDHCYQLIFIEKAGNAPADRVKMQVLPHGGKYKQDPPDYANESLRQQQAVEATLRTMREKRSELGVGKGTQTFVKIKETVAICLWILDNVKYFM